MEDKEIRKRRREAAADRRIGHDLAYWYEFAPLLARGACLALLAAGGAWVWFNVDHRLIALISAAFGIVGVGLYVASTIAATSPNARMMARATGRPTRPRWWHGVGLAGALLLALAYVAMPF
jgi:hypothetical protein